MHCSVDNNCCVRNARLITNKYTTMYSNDTSWLRGGRHHIMVSAQDKFWENAHRRDRRLKTSKSIIIVDGSTAISIRLDVAKGVGEETKNLRRHLATPRVYVNVYIITYSSVRRGPPSRPAHDGCPNPIPRARIDVRINIIYKPDT